MVSYEGEEGKGAAGEGRHILFFFSAKQAS